MRRPSAEEEAHLRAGVKGEIRGRRRAMRRALPSDARALRSAAIVRALLSLPEWQAARTVMAFVPMRTEVQIQAAVEAAWASGKRVAVPRMRGFEELDLFEWHADTELEESGMMFLQPPADAPAVAEDEVDLVIVPALAVDDRGYRIGYGKGFYDRLLPRLTQATRVAVIFSFEQVAEVPNLPHDERVDAVLTDERLVRVEPPRG